MLVARVVLFPHHRLRIARASEHLFSKLAISITMRRSKQKMPHRIMCQIGVAVVAVVPSHAAAGPCCAPGTLAMPLELRQARMPVIRWVKAGQEGWGGGA